LYFYTLPFSFGYYIFPGSTAGHYSRANGSGGWLSVGILTSDLPGLVTPGGCTNCSVTFNAEGQATAFSSGGGGGITYAAISSNVTLSANTLNGVDTSSPRSLTMPAPVSGVVVELKDITGTASTNNITINPNGSEKVEFGSNYVVGNNAFGASFFSNGVDWFIRYIYQPVFIAATCVGCSTSYYNNIEVMAWAPSGASGATGSFTVSSAPQGTAFEFFLEGGGGGGGTYGGGASAYPVYLTGQVAAVTTYRSLLVQVVRVMAVGAELEHRGIAPRFSLKPLLVVVTADMLAMVVTEAMGAVVDLLVAELQAEPEPLRVEPAIP
jgi:hypothetical protein